MTTTYEDIVRLSEQQLPDTADEFFADCVRDYPKVLLIPDKDNDGPVLIIERSVLDECPNPLAFRNGEAHWCQLTFQIFHTNVQKLSSRKHVVPVDHDLRRPIVFTATSDHERHLKYLMKNSGLFIAFENIQIDRVEDKFVVFKQTSSYSQSHIHSFVAWRNFALGVPVPNWCVSKAFSNGKESHVVHGKLPNGDQLTKLVRGEATLKDLGLEMEVTTETLFDSDRVFKTIDGQAIAQGEMERHSLNQYQKEKLAAAEGLTKQ